jgi:pimeloyl-ACP methyl ester carboxylesterase
MQSRRQFVVRGSLAAASLSLRPAIAASRRKPAIKKMDLRANGFLFDALAAGPPSGELVLFLHGFPQFADAWSNILPPIAAAGFHSVAVSQRGYSRGAQPPEVQDYATDLLVADALAFADALQAPRFHLVGHDWGGAVAWKLAAAHPERLRTLTVLSTPNLNAFAAALQNDPDQQKKSEYFTLFRAPNHLAENTLLADDAKVLRSAYRGKVPAAEVEENVRRFSHPPTLTCALNWYRASDIGPIANITVPTLYIWGDQDQALGETAALATAHFVTGPYRFERLAGRSHWLMEEIPEQIVAVPQAQLQTATSSGAAS